MTRTGRRISLAILAIATFALFTAGLLIGTTAGSKWLLHQLLALSPAPVSIERIEGRLADRLVLHEVRVNWQGSVVEIDDLTLEWSPWGLPLRTLAIHRLELNALTISLAAAGDESTPAEPLRLTWPALPDSLKPWRVRIDELLLQEIRLLRPPADALSAEALTAGLSLEDGQLVIDTLEVQVADRRILADLEFGLKTPGIKGRLAIIDTDDRVAEDLALSLDLQQTREDGILSGPLQGTAGLPDWPELRLDGTLLLREDRLELAGLRLTRSAPAGVITGRLTLSWAATDPHLEAELAVQEWALVSAPEETMVIGGRLTTAGRLDEHRGSFDLAIAGDSWREAHLVGNWTGTRNNLEVTLRQGKWLDGELDGTVVAAWGARSEARIKLAARQLDPARLAADWSGSLNLTANIDLLQEAEELQIGFDAAFADSLLRGIPLRGDTRGRWRQGALELDRLNLQGDGFALQAQGTLAERFNLNLAVDDLGGLIPQSRGKLHGRGWLSYRDGDWLADFVADADNLRLGELSLNAAKLSLHRPEASSPAKLRLDADEAGFGILQLNALQAKLNGVPGKHELTITTGLPGGNIRAAVAGSQSDTGWQGTLNELRINQEQAGDWRLVEPVALQVDSRSVVLGMLHLRSHSGELSLAGRFKQDSRLHHFKFSAKQLPLKVFDPLLAPWSLAGDLDADLACDDQGCQFQTRGIDAVRHADQELRFKNAQADGAWTNAGLKADLSFSLGEDGQLAGSLTSAAPLNWQLPGDGQLTLFLRKLNPAPLLRLVDGTPLLGSLSGEFTANWQNHQPDRIDLDIGGPLSWLTPEQQKIALDLSLQGGWHHDGLALKGSAVLMEGGQIHIQATSPELPQWNLPGSAAWTASWSDFPLLGYYHPSPQVKVSGAWSGQAEGMFADSLDFHGKGQAAINGGRLVWHDEDAGEVAIHLQDATANWLWQKDRLQGGLNLGLEGKGQLAAEWSLPIPARWPITPTEQGGLEGRLTGRFAESGLLGQFAPNLIQETHGELAVALALDGTWQDPVLTGSAKLQNGGGYLPAPGIRLKNLALDMHFEKNRIQFSGLSVESGPGSLSGEGFVTLQGWRPTTLDLAVRGEQFALTDLPELQLSVSPDLKLTGTPEAPVLTGDIRIPAFLAAGRSERNPIPVSRDVVMVDAKQQDAPATPLKLSTQVRLLLGEQVLVKMFGLDARLGGQLELTGIDLQHFSGRGEIHIEEGTYATYGVKLKIEKGRAFYAGGPLDNPAIDILALRKAGEVKAGVQIRGTAKRPDAKLYAEPAMTDTDILSYITLGRPLSQAGGETDALMLAAGALLSVGDSAVLRSQLQGQLGIDTLEADSGTGKDSDTVLRLGKYLTPDIYISYGYALFGQHSEVGLRYRFMDNWEAESKFGVESGADLYYRFEFD